MVTIRLRSTVWLVTGAMLATAVMLMFVNAWRVDAAPGDTDSTFVPITACRLMDTRPAPDRVGPHGTLSAKDTTTVPAKGSNGKCVVPSDAVGLSLNVTALNATAPTGSFLTFWPDGTLPLAASLNPSPGQPPVPNAVTVLLSGAGAFNVYNEAGTVDIIVDVNGYYTKATLQELAQRVVALETAQAAGVDPAVLARLAALETTTATHTSGIATNTSGIATNTSGIATNTSGIAALDTAQPFAVTNFDNTETVTSVDNVVVAVAVTAPVAGQVTVNSTSTVTEATGGDRLRCSIANTAIYDDSYGQEWASAGNPGVRSQLAGTRTFDIAAGVTATYNLICNHAGSSGSGALDDIVLTAIFTPAP